MDRPVRRLESRAVASMEVVSIESRPHTFENPMIGAVLLIREGVGGSFNTAECIVDLKRDTHLMHLSHAYTYEWVKCIASYIDSINFLVIHTTQQLRRMQ